MPKRILAIAGCLIALVVVCLFFGIQKANSLGSSVNSSANLERQRYIARSERHLRNIRNKYSSGQKLNSRDEDLLVDPISQPLDGNLQIQASLLSSVAVYKKALSPNRVRAAIFKAVMDEPDGSGRQIHVMSITLIDELGDDVLSKEVKDRWTEVRKLAWSPDNYLDKAEIGFLKVAIPSSIMDDRMRALRLLVKKGNLKIENIRLVHSLADEAASKATGKERELWNLALKIFDKYNTGAAEGSKGK